MKSEVSALLQKLGVPESEFTNGDLQVTTPLTGEEIGAVNSGTRESVAAQVERAHDAFMHWRTVPAPRRGELVRLLGDELRMAKEELGRLVSIEVGKIPSEGLGEVQEMIDICDFAVGLSRQLYGLTIASERPGHRMMEVWHPLGVTGVISAFNFPVAVWSWNSALALVCGNSVIWKPSEKTPLSALRLRCGIQKSARPIWRCTGGLARACPCRSSRRCTNCRKRQSAVDIGYRFYRDGSTGRSPGCREVRAHNTRTRRQQCRDRQRGRRSGYGTSRNSIQRRWPRPDRDALRCAGFLRTKKSTMTC